MSNTPLTAQQEQDYFRHVHQCISNPEYARWYDEFKVIHKEHDYSLFPLLIQLHKDGFTPQQTHDKFKSPRKKGWSKDKGEKDTYAVVFEGFEQSNTTPVPDILFDELLDQLTGTELKVLLYIIRRTKGFKKDSDAISLNQFQHGITTKDGKQLDKGCGIKRRQTIVDALISLEKKGYIVSYKTKTSEGDDATTVYQIRFKGVVSKPDYLSSLGGSFKTGLPSFNNGLGVVAKTGLPVVSKSDPQETVIQQTVIQEKESTSANESTTPKIAGKSSHSSTQSFASSTETKPAEIPITEPPIANATPSEPARNTTPSKFLEQAPRTEPLSQQENGLTDEERRIQGYWCQMDFTERPSAKKHWGTLSKHVASYEDMKSLYDYTEKEILNDPKATNKSVKPGNLANSNTLDGWKQYRRREQAEQAKQETKAPSRPKTVQEMTALERVKYYEQRYGGKKTAATLSAERQ